MAAWRRLPGKYDTWRAPDGRTVRIWYSWGRSRITSLWGAWTVRIAVFFSALTVVAGVVASGLPLSTDPGRTPSIWLTVGGWFYAATALVCPILFLRAAADSLRRTTLRGPVIRLTTQVVGEESTGELYWPPPAPTISCARP